MFNRVVEYSVLNCAAADIRTIACKIYYDVVLNISDVTINLYFQ